MSLIFCCGMEALTAYRIEYLRSKQLDVSEETKKKIQQEGMYHITTKENAEKIVESGYMRPSVGITANHFAKSRYGDKFANFVYMFGGKPPAKALNTISYKGSKDGTLYAVKYKPDKFEMENFTQRLSDGAITYEGRLDIGNFKPEIVRLKVEKGKVREIPLDEQIKLNPLQKMTKTKIVGFLKTSGSTLKQLIATNFEWRDKRGQLKACIENRRIENKYIAQYNTEEQSTTIGVSKNDKNYTFTTIGTKKEDGKILTGFHMVEEGNGLEKNVFMDAMDINSVSRKNLQTFLSRYMNEKSERSEYMGKLVVREDGKIRREMDDNFKHHFYKKQLLAMKTEPEYQKYLAELKLSREDKMIELADNYLQSVAKTRKNALEYIKSVFKSKNREQNLEKNGKSVEEAYER